MMPFRTTYTKTAKLLHWLIAILIILQLSAGIWMVDAINEPATQATAFDVYQWHKAIGLTILLLMLFRLVWRAFHRSPELPYHMQRWERLAAYFSHYFLYILGIAIPLLGWATVSLNPYGLPTMYFNWFQWPHIPFPQTIVENKDYYGQIFQLAHRYTAYFILCLVLIHALAALKHHFINKDDVLKRMLPRFRD